MDSAVVTMRNIIYINFFVAGARLEITHSRAFCSTEIIHTQGGAMQNSTLIIIFLIFFIELYYFHMIALWTVLFQ